MANGMQRKWYERPWTWVTAGCCLGCVVIPLGCFAIVGTGGFLALTKSPVMQEALERAQQSEALVAEIGEPIEHRWLGGSTSLNIDGSRSRLVVSIGGPDGTAELSGEGRRRGGAWVFSRLEARLDDGRVVDLLTDQVLPDDRPYEPLPLEEPAGTGPPGAAPAEEPQAQDDDSR